MSAPPASVLPVNGWPNTAAPRIAVQNGSIVDTIAPRTGPNVASPRRNARKPATVQSSASPAAAPHAVGVRRAVSVRSAVDATRNTSPAPAATYVDATTGDVDAS